MFRSILLPLRTQTHVTKGCSAASAADMELIELHCCRYAFPEGQLPADTLRALRNPKAAQRPDL